MGTPSDSEIIYDLMESFGHLWEPEPPLYSRYCDVVAVKEIGTSWWSQLPTRSSSEGIEDLSLISHCQKAIGRLSAYVRDEATQEWKFESSERTREHGNRSRS